MAIDMSKMRERLTQLQSKGSGGSSAFWRPSDGNQTIRIVTTRDGDPFKDYFFHYNGLCIAYKEFPFQFANQ